MRLREAKQLLQGHKSGMGWTSPSTQVFLPLFFSIILYHSSLPYGLRLHISKLRLLYPSNSEHDLPLRNFV